MAFCSKMISIISSILNNAHQFPGNFWGITENDLSEFKILCKKVSEKMLSLLKGDVDERK